MAIAHHDIADKQQASDDGERHDVGADHEKERANTALPAIDGPLGCVGDPTDPRNPVSPDMVFSLIPFASTKAIF